MTYKTPFPTDMLYVDLFYDGVWNDITSDVSDEGVFLKVGSGSEGMSRGVSEFEFQVRNGDGKYSPRNAMSPLYGKIGRNTPARVRTALGLPWIAVSGDGSAISIPHDNTATTSLSAVLDLRWYGRRDDWVLSQDLISKYNTVGDKRSWSFNIVNGMPRLWVSKTGLADGFYSNSTMNIPAGVKEIALRVTYTASTALTTFYTAETLSGPWTQLGDPVTNAGGTGALYKSAEPLRVGEGNTLSTGPRARVYGWSIRSVINSTVYSSFTDASTLTPGATSFPDIQAHTCTLVGGAEITNAHVLSIGEISEWPVEWNRKGAPSVLSTIVANGISRRLGQGQSALDSPLFRTLSGLPDVVAYWPMEEPDGATAFGPVVGATLGIKRGNPNLASYDDIPGSYPTVTLNDGDSIDFPFRSYTNTNKVQVRWVATHKAATVNKPFIRVNFTSGTLDYADFRIMDTGQINFRLYDTDENELYNVIYSNPAVDVPYWGSLEFSPNASNSNNMDYKFVYKPIGATSGSVYSNTFTSERAGRVSLITVGHKTANLTGTGIGHLLVANQISSIFDVGPTLEGYAEEDAGVRIRRIATETGVPVVINGGYGGSPQMGPQPFKSTLEIYQDCIDVSHGLMHDAQEEVALRFRTVRSMYSQVPVTIPYQDNLIIPFEPLDDDKMTRNQVTIARPKGIRYSDIVTDGALGVNTVGLYDDAKDLNLYTDEQPKPHAEWETHIGTFDGARYPRLGVDLANPILLNDSALQRKLLSLTPGDRLVITNPPEWLPQESVDVIIVGISYEVLPKNFEIRWTCIPARPYNIAMYDRPLSRYSGLGTVLTSGVNTTATSLTVTPPSGVVWTAEDGSYVIDVAGEHMTVTNVVGNTLTVTRSTNGVVKSHAAGTALDIAEPVYYAL